MKNRIVKQVLMICMVSALSVSMPITSFAADSKKEVNITVRQSRQSGVARATCPD